MPTDNETREPTPTEWLVMELLAARYALGELNLLFPNTLRPALNRLTDRGWIERVIAVGGRTQVRLSPAGIEAWVGEDVIPPRQPGEFDDPMDDPRNGLPLTPDPNRRRWWQRGRR